MTGEAGARPVTALIEAEGVKDLVTVSTAAGSVVATAGHPFWSVSDAAWVDAGELQVGDAVLEADGTETVVTATTELTVRATVFNLTVADIHTYFVVVGDAATLVHNCQLPGYNNFRAAKRDLGSPGEGNVFDHVVEQSQIKRSGFHPAEIHHPFNLNPVPAWANQAKANLYSSIQPYTGGQRVRDWLNGQSFEAQYSFGMDRMAEILRGGAQ